MITRKGPFVGVEVEGRLKGVRTLFLGEVPLVAYVTTVYYQKCPHIFIRNQAVTRLKEIDWQTIERWVDENHYIVTLECDQGDVGDIPLAIAAKVHIMCVLDLFSLSRLKETDTIKMRSGDGQSLTVTVGNCLRHKIEDYSEDRMVQIEEREEGEEELPKVDRPYS